MKNYKWVIVWVVAIMPACLFSQISPVSSTNVSYFDLLNFSAFCKEDILYKIDNAIVEGKIEVYESLTFDKPLNVNSYYERRKLMVHRLIPNPYNPDDIYDLIDTVILDWSMAQDFVIPDKKAIGLIFANDTKMYVKQNQVKRLLGKRSTAVFDFFNHSGLTMISDSELAVFWSNYVKQLGKQLYLYGFGGEVKAYRNDSLQSTYTIEEIKDRVLISDWQQIQNPNNPGDIYDLIDTVIVTEFNPDSINTIRLLFEWQTEGFETEAKFIAIAPLFKPFVAGIQLSRTPIFWVADEEYLKKLNKVEKAFWPHFYSYMLQNRSAGGEYDVFDENNLPTE